MNPVKELHYFDTLYKIRTEKTLKNFSRRQLEHEINRIVRASKFDFIDKRYKNLLRTSLLLSTQPVEQLNYLDLFRPCVADNQILGEITPEYMILPKEGIIKMRETIGDHAKIILLARNPVKRFISAFKLLMSGLPAADMDKFEENILSMLESNGEWLKVQDALNDYQQALKNYQEVFDHVLLLSYDDLFGDAEKTANALADFLGIAVDLPKYQQVIATKVNALEDTKALTDETVSLLTTRYASHQAYLDKIFGAGVCNA